MPRSRTWLALSPHRLARHIASLRPSRYDNARSTPYEYTGHDPTLNSSGYTLPSYPEHVEDHEGHADGDRRIRHVEGPEMPVVPVEIHEVEHVPERDAIDQVACGAGDDERETHPTELLRDVERGGIDGQAGQRRRRDEWDHQGFVREVYGIEQPECRAGVVHAGQIQPARNHLDALAVRQP